MHENLASKVAVSFVVPCFNERENVADALCEIEKAADEAGVAKYEILAVDDCSTDGTGALVAALTQQKPYVTLISNPHNLGFGGAYKEGVKRAIGTYVIMVPGDNAHPRDGIIPILRRAGEADIVIPYAANPEARSRPRRATSFLFTFLINRLFGLSVPYFNGLVLHKTALLQTIEIKTSGFAYQAEALVKLILDGATYCTVPVTISERNTGRSSAFTLKNVYRVANAVFQLWRETHHLPARSRQSETNLLQTFSADPGSS